MEFIKSVWKWFNFKKEPIYLKDVVNLLIFFTIFVIIIAICGGLINN